jgi:hypothetical protein
MATNLPPQQIEDSAASTKLFFDTYGQAPLEFNAVEVDACVSFFVKKGFANDAALVVSTALLKQAKAEGQPIFRILDSLSGFNNLQLSTLVGEILNNNRTPSSVLGFRTKSASTDQSRNISA